MTRPSQAVVEQGTATRHVVPGERTAEIVAFETAMVAFFVDAADLLGVPKSVAAIYGIVFSSPTPLNFAEIEARLDISKGSISQGLRVLREVGAVKEVSSEGDRAEAFVPDLELRRLVLRFLENRVQKELTGASSRLTRLKQSAASLSAPSRKVLGPRIHKLQRWHDRSRALLPVMKTFLNIAG